MLNRVSLRSEGRVSEFCRGLRLGERQWDFCWVLGPSAVCWVSDPELGWNRSRPKRVWLDPLTNQMTAMRWDCTGLGLLYSIYLSWSINESNDWASCYIQVSLSLSMLPISVINLSLGVLRSNPSCLIQDVNQNIGASQCCYWSQVAWSSSS